MYNFIGKKMIMSLDPWDLWGHTGDPDVQPTNKAPNWGFLHQTDQ